MRKIANIFLWVFVATIPLQQFQAQTLVAVSGTFTRLVGIAATAVAIVALLQEGRIRKPSKGFMFMALFVSWAWISFVWSAQPENTVGRAMTNIQLLIMVFLLVQFSRNKVIEAHLIQAYIIGCYVTLFVLIQQYSRGLTLAETHGGTVQRFTAFDNDPNELALGLALGIPFAWYLLMSWRHRSNIINITTKLINGIYILMASFGILLTSSRGGLLSLTAAALIIPFSVFSLRGGRKVMVVWALVAIGFTVITFVPESSWKRLLTITEVVGDSSRRSYGMQEGPNIRVVVWRKGIETFKTNPTVAVIGVGASGFKEGVGEIRGERFVAHNSFISILLELGLVGSIFFIGILYYCFRSLLSMEGLRKMCWVFALFTWTVGAQFLSYEHRKETWFILGMIMASQFIHKRHRKASSALLRMLRLR